MTMEGVNTTRLPPIVRFQVGGYATERESLERSWARIRTCLIDNPRDSGQNKRQEVWSYHKKNRGVLTSLVKSLPNIPFRIGRSKKRSHSDQELNPKNGESESFLPKISSVGMDLSAKNGKVRPLGTVNKSDEIIPAGKLKYQKNIENSAIKFTSPGNVKAHGVDEIKQLKTIEDGANNKSRSKCESRLPRLPLVLKQPLSKSRVVSFSTNDLCDSSLNDNSRRDSTGSFSEDSYDSERSFDKVKFGHSSQHVTEPIPKSVLDIISGTESRTMGDRTKRERKTGTVETATFPGVEVDKEWFEKVLGDKEIIDMSNYENFARTPRTRPINEPIPRYQNTLSTSNSPDRKSKMVTSRSPLKVQFDIPSEDRSQARPVFTEPSRKPAGEPIAAYQRATNSPSYFPLFSRDGSPIRKIGGPPKSKQPPPTKLKISFPNSTPTKED